MMIELQDLYDLAVEHNKKGAEIWNSLGLDNPQFVNEAAKLAITEYDKCVKLLTFISSRLTDTELNAHMLGLKEFVLAESAAIETHLYNEWNDEGLKQIISVIEREISHRQTSLHFLLASSGASSSDSFDRRIGVLFAEGRRDFLLARLAGRMNDLENAKKHYTQSKETYEVLLNLFEEFDAELVLVKESAEQALTSREDSLRDDDEEDRENSGIRWTAITYRFPNEITGSQYEDLYRRTAANYYVTASQEADFTALEMLHNGRAPNDIESKVEESIRYLDLAMEIFPNNLEFHQDLFNLWRGRGETLGCQMRETARDYHFRCPLAIMHHLGGWYVSPTFEYGSLLCSVCGKDAVECEHYPGQAINGQIVQYRRSNPIVSSISIVDVPEDPACRIEWISIPKNIFQNEFLGQRPIIQCRFCHPELFDEVAFPLLPSLSGVVRDEIERRYRQIMNSTRIRPIQVVIPSSINNITVDESNGET